MRTIRVLAILCALASLAWSLGTAQTPIYSLSYWPCGAIIWPGEVPGYAEHFSQRLAAAAETAFGFWGYELPVAAEPPYNEANAFQIYDPAADALCSISPLDWDGHELMPVVVLAFSRESDLRLAMGNSSLYAAFWSQWPLSRQAFPGAEPWIWDVGVGYRNMVCASSAEDRVLIHEFGHWFTFQWAAVRGVQASHLPNYITEGIAEATCAVAEDANDTVYRRLQAASWAKSKCLEGSIQGVMQYPVGQSLVSYLIKTMTTNGFLETLSDWSSQASIMIDQVQPGWRESLGLPASCPGEDTEP